MEEKILIKGQKSNPIIVCLIAALIPAIVIFIVCLCIWDPTYYLDTSLFGAGVVGIVVGLITFGWLSKMKLTVSNKRVFGCVAFGKRVDLPVDSISAIGTSWLKGIDISTSSGTIKFKLISNNTDVHKIISNLLMERQSKQTTTFKQETAQSNAEELKEYKELLDSGIISQEEFDAKKKQLLGL